MPFIEEIAAYLTAQSTVFDLAPSSTSVPLWLGKIGESSPDTSVGLYETGGAAPEYTQAGFSHERTSLQVISRSSSYVNASANARSIYNILSVVDNAQINKSPSTGTTLYLTITPNQSPFEIGEDDKQRQLFSCNYFIEKELS